MTERSMATHTPGPWHVVEVYDGITSPKPNGLVYAKIQAADGSVGFAGAYLSREGKPNDEAKANAALIAAAPDLLAALEGLRRELRQHIKLDVKKHYSLMVWDAAAGQAIRKATRGTGESPPA